MSLPSLKLASDTTRLRDSNRATKRGVTIRQTNDFDLRWLWAAYQKGVWNDVLAEGLSQADFKNTVIEILGAVEFDWVFEVRTDKGLRPVGLVTAQSRFAGRAIKPHVDWFPWASPRNRLECGIQFVKEIGREVKIFLYIKEKDDKLWNRVWQYKVLKKGCKIHDCYASGEDAMMYYTPGPF